MERQNQTSMSNAPKKNTKATPLAAPTPQYLHLSDRSYEPLDHRTPAAARIIMDSYGTSASLTADH